MKAAIFTLMQSNFVLWRPAKAETFPKLVLGKLVLGTPVAFVEILKEDLKVHNEFDDLWLLPVSDLALTEDTVYHYWFEVALPGTETPVRITDPLSFSVDWRIAIGNYAASVTKYKNGILSPCDAGGEEAGQTNFDYLSDLPANNRMVIYELPTTWTKTSNVGEREIGLGSFRDVTSLVISTGQTSDLLEEVAGTKAYLELLGINALQLLPPADSFYNRQWGYGTTNFLSPDFELGYAGDYSWSAATRDLKQLIDACHKQGVRFIADVVMAFSKENPYLVAAPDDFFMLEPQSHPQDPDARNSRGSGFRDGYGSTLLRYARSVVGYDPISGTEKEIFPSRQLMKLAAIHWVSFFGVDGFRLDSVENIANWDFVEEFKDTARSVSKEKFSANGLDDLADQRFLVVGEELSEPKDLIFTNRLDGLWHEKFKAYVRRMILGRNGEDEPSFEWTVRKAIDCRNLGYTDGAQTILYLTSHDVEGVGNERLFNFLVNNKVQETEKRIKLAFCCLLTSVGIPMILAGEEFADQHDLFNEEGNVSQGGGKQVDPVNFSRASDPWRSRVKEYVSKLIRFRTISAALSVNDTRFLHMDFDQGRRILVWQRGLADDANKVIVVANFSDFESSGGSNAEYRINNWPSLPVGMRWKEITQDRFVPNEWAGREPLFSWEAKVYAAVS